MADQRAPRHLGQLDALGERAMNCRRADRVVQTWTEELKRLVPTEEP